MKPLQKSYTLQRLYKLCLCAFASWSKIIHMQSRKAAKKVICFEV
jgi:hypothetical protein